VKYNKLAMMTVICLHQVPKNIDLICVVTLLFFIITA